MDDHEIILRIQELLDGVEWTPDTAGEIAKLLTDNGYRVRDLDDRDDPYENDSVHGKRANE